jgi:hypothetical protein
LAQSHALLALRVDDITHTLRRQDERAVVNMEKLTSIETSLADNTRMTMENAKVALENSDNLKLIRDAVTTGRVLRSVSAWLAGFILTGTAVWATIKGALK